MKRNRPPIAPLMALHKTVSDKPIHKAHRTRVGQAKNAPQLIVGRPKAMPNHHQRRSRFTGVADDAACRRLDAASDSKPNGTKQIGSAINHLR